MTISLTAFASRLALPGVLAAALALSACDASPASARAAAAKTATTTPVAVAPAARAVAPPSAAAPAAAMDSMLGRFRSRTAGTAERLRDGGGSVDDIAARYVRAIAERDTQAVRSLLATRAEFADLFFPSSPYARPPYEMDPEVVWMQLFADSDKGTVRAFRELGGSGIRYVGHRCADVRRQGANTLRGCDVTVRWPSGEERELRLFGPIIERGGIFKFLSLDNRL